MKNQTIVFFMLLVITGKAQEPKEQQSKMLDFVSQTGVIIKFEDYNLPNIKLLYNVAQSRIRKVNSGNETRFFLQISHGTQTAFIAYEDIVEIQKAFMNLKEQSGEDSITVSDYLENKFITEDGFQIGYYVNKKKLAWYMKLEKYGSDNTVFAKDYESLYNVFQLGKGKIELLKQTSH